MFARTITESDAFIDMPLSAQALYLHIGMNADDEGFVNGPKRIQRCVGAAEDDLKLLIAKGFLIAFDSGVVVVKHWKMNNYIQNDRFKPTVYKEERALLSENQNKSYSLSETPRLTCMDTECIQDVSNVDTQVRLGKVSLGKSKEDICASSEAPSKKTSRFVPPSVDEVAEYIASKGYTFDPEAFVAFYESKGWMIGKNKMKSWKSACTTWSKKERGQSQFQQNDYSGVPMFEF